MKIKELVYMVLDEIKGLSDDFTYTEDHVIFLLNKYRTSLLKQKYKDDKETMHSSNFQTISLTLKDSLQNKDYLLERQYKQSNELVPQILTDKGIRVYPETQFLDNADIAFITEDRMRYVGYNKYLKNAVYATLHNDYLYITSRNLDIMDLEQVYLSAVFEDAIEAIKAISEDADLLEEDFPMEDSLTPLLIQSVIKELLGAAYRPKDQQNNANDDLADMIAFMRRNMKSAYQKQIEGDD